MPACIYHPLCPIDSSNSLQSRQDVYTLKFHHILGERLMHKQHDCIHCQI